MKRRHLHAFRDKLAKEHLPDTRDLGVLQVPVARITGSVARWVDYDAQFRPKYPEDLRWQRILNAVQEGRMLPPVELYKVGDRYYVVDGNHRVAAARQTGQEYIDAHVVEYLPPCDTPEHVLWRERSRFEFKSGLRGINLSDPEGYSLMFDHIRRYKEELAAQEPVTVRTAARRWQRKTYDPLVKAIKEQGLDKLYPGRNAADLALYILQRKLIKAKAGGKDSYRQTMQAFRARNYTDLSARIPGLFRGMVITDDCDECGRCLQACPKNLIYRYENRAYIGDLCDECGQCRDKCPKGAIRPYHEMALGKEDQGKNEIAASLEKGTRARGGPARGGSKTGTKRTQP